MCASRLAKICKISSEQWGNNYHSFARKATPNFCCVFFKYVLGQGARVLKLAALQAMTLGAKAKQCFSKGPGGVGDTFC